MKDIEQNSHAIKERAREMIRTFPFKKITGRIIIELIQFVGIWINQDPSDNRVLDVYSPQNIITGQELDYEKH